MTLYMTKLFLSEGHSFAKQIFSSKLQYVCEQRFSRRTHINELIVGSHAINKIAS